MASVGSKGDSFDNALAESFNGLYKWELIYRQGPWRGLDDVEFATMTYVDWFNHRRLHGEITNDPSYTTPAEAEAATTTVRPARLPSRPPNSHSSHATRGASPIADSVHSRSRTPQAAHTSRSRLSRHTGPTANSKRGTAWWTPGPSLT